MPEDRVAQVLRALIDSPERFLQFVRALLGGLEGLVDWMGEDGSGACRGEWGVVLNGETLLEGQKREQVMRTKNGTLVFVSREAEIEVVF